jgi:hypothetical protein
MILNVYTSPARSHAVGDEIWHEALADVIRAEAQTIARNALSRSATVESRTAVRHDLFVAMTAALRRPGDTYLAPGGILYSVDDEPECDGPIVGDTLARMSASEPVVQEIVRFENLPIGSLASRRVIVRWSDGTEGEGLRWYGDEVLVCEGDVLGKTRAQLHALHFRRDRDWLQS